jgi:hypothetical protein
MAALALMIFVWGCFTWLILGAHRLKASVQIQRSIGDYSTNKQNILKVNAFN